MNSNKTKLLFVEDDPNQAAWIAEEVVWKANPGIDLLFYESEYSFMKAIEENKIQDWRPTHAIFDLLIRYYSPHDLAEIKREGKTDRDFVKLLEDLPLAKEAGIRCRKALLKECPNVKVKTCIATVLDDRFDDVLAFGKGDDQFASEIASFLDR